MTRTNMHLKRQFPNFGKLTSWQESDQHPLPDIYQSLQMDERLQMCQSKTLKKIKEPLKGIQKGRLAVCYVVIIIIT